MKRNVYLVTFALFVAAFLYDLIVWGAVPRLPEVGGSIANSARLEAPLASTYIWLGSRIDGAVPSLQAFGAERLTDAFGEGFRRIAEDSTVAIDLIFNTTWNLRHRWIKTVYWAAPLLLVLTVILYLLRPRRVQMIGRRR